MPPMTGGQIFVGMSFWLTRSGPVVPSSSPLPVSPSRDAGRARLRPVVNALTYNLGGDDVTGEPAAGLHRECAGQGCVAT